MRCDLLHEVELPAAAGDATPDGARGSVAPDGYVYASPRCSRELLRIGLELRLIIRGRFVDDEASHYDAADVFQ